MDAPRTIYSFLRAVVEAVRSAFVKSIRFAVAEAIGPVANGNAQMEPQPTPGPPAITSIELQIPESLIAQFEANAKRQDDLDKRQEEFHKRQEGFNAKIFWIGCTAVVISAASLVSLIIYVSLTLGVWKAQIESANEQTRALEVRDRAYLSLGPLESQELGTFALPVSNGGHVPASYSITLNFTRVLLDRRHRSIGKPLIGNLESPGDGTVQPGATHYIIVGLRNSFSPKERALLLRGYENASVKITLTYDTGFGKRDRISTVACFSGPQGDLRWNQLCGAANILDLGQASKFHTYKEDPAN